MIFYLVDQTRIVSTQADARAINPDFTQIDIPTDKAGLRVYVQGLFDQIAEASVTSETENHSLSGPCSSAGADHAPCPAVNDCSVADQIMDADAKNFGAIFQATLERLGELRGEGFTEMRRLVSDDARSRTAIERGLGYLILEANNGSAE